MRKAKPKRATTIKEGSRRTVPIVDRHGKPIQAGDLKVGREYFIHPDGETYMLRKKPLPVKGVYDLSVLSVGDLLRELRARGFVGEMTYKP
jgi:hypothetical protein